MQAADSQDPAKAAWFNLGMDLDLLHPLGENSDAATIPSDPDLVANELGGYFVEGAGHFDVTVAVDVAPGFLVGGKKRVWQWLKVRPFLLKTSYDPVCASCQIGGKINAYNVMLQYRWPKLSTKAVKFIKMVSRGRRTASGANAFSTCIRRLFQASQSH